MQIVCTTLVPGHWCLDYVSESKFYFTKILLISQQIRSLGRAIACKTHTRHLFGPIPHR